MKIKVYLLEIKTRFYYILFCFFLTLFTSYIFINEFIYLLALPLKNAFNVKSQHTQNFINLEIKDIEIPNVYLDTPGVLDNSQFNFHFIFTDITEVFSAHLYVSLFISIYLILPKILYQFWLFLKPGLYINEKKIFFYFIFFSLCMAIINLLLTYFIILPGACNFFLSFEINNDSILKINLEPKIYTYICLILKFIIWSQIIFQIPVLLLFSIKLGLIPLKKTLDIIITKRKIFYLSLILINGMISPSDILSQFICSIFSILIFELCIFILIFQKSIKNIN